MSLPSLPDQFEEGDYEFRKVGEKEVEQIRRWLEEPHITDWWTPSEDSILAMQSIKSDPKASKACFIVSYKGGDFAYIQYYDPADDIFWEANPQPDGTVGIDQFIGDANMLGYGHGSKFIKAFLEHLKKAEGVSRIIVDPAPDNTPAIRCFSQVGFRQERTIDTPEGPALLMSQKVLS